MDICSYNCWCCDFGHYRVFSISIPCNKNKANPSNNCRKPIHHPTSCTYKILRVGSTWWLKSLNFHRIEAKHVDASSIPVLAKSFKTDFAGYDWKKSMTRSWLPFMSRVFAEVNTMDVCFRPNHLYEKTSSSYTWHTGIRSKTSWRVLTFYQRIICCLQNTAERLSQRRGQSCRT